MVFRNLNFAVDGDSITAGEQWSWHVFKELGLKSHYNVAVGSSVWYKRTTTTSEGSVTTQNYDDPDFAGISDGWLETDDLNELQMRANNCAVVHVQHFLSDVKKGLAEKPDVFAFAMGTTMRSTSSVMPKRHSSEKRLTETIILICSPRRELCAGAYRR